MENLEQIKREYELLDYAAGETCETLRALSDFMTLKLEVTHLNTLARGLTLEEFREDWDSITDMIHFVRNTLEREHDRLKEIIER